LGTDRNDLALLLLVFDVIHIHDRFHHLFPAPKDASFGRLTCTQPLAIENSLSTNIQ